MAEGWQKFPSWETSVSEFLEPRTLSSNICDSFRTLLTHRLGVSPGCTASSTHSGIPVYSKVYHILPPTEESIVCFQWW